MTRFTRALAVTLGVVFLGFVVTLVLQRNASGAPGPLRYNLLTRS